MIKISNVFMRMGSEESCRVRTKPHQLGWWPTMEENCRYRKGCLLFAVNISSDKGKEVEDAYVLHRYPTLQ